MLRVLRGEGEHIMEELLSAGAFGLLPYPSHP
jgi:hypothetical protein